MENPTTWGKPERIVHDVLQQWWSEREVSRRSEHGAPGSVAAGLSLERRITDALRDAGQISASTPPGYYDDLARRFHA